MRKQLVLLLVPMLALAGTVTETFTFDSRDIEIAEVNGYDVISFADFTTTLEIGRPLMPEAVFNALIPPTARVTSIEVTVLDAVELPGTYNVHPVQQPRPLSSTEDIPFAGPDPAVYDGDRQYPDKLVDWVDAGTKSGWRIAPFALHPLTWNPATGKLTLHRQLEVDIHYAEGYATPTPLTPSQQNLLGRAVTGIVVNPHDIEKFAPPLRISDDPDVDYAIITSSSLEAGFAPLVAWKKLKGYNTEVFTTSWITSNYTGRDTPEKIRNFIIDYFENRGLKFVILGGDNSVVPGRRCRVSVSGTTGNIPADAYYGDLQWSWDGNGNNIFGEMSGDTVDLFFDVYVGRASVDNATQVQTFVNKALAYEKAPTTDYLQKMFLPYVQLWTGYSGRIINDTIANATPSGWTDYLVQPNNTSTMRNAINEGYHFCHPAAHGSETSLASGGGATIYSTSTASGQTNATRPVILNSMACLSGDFEHNDCLAEALMNNSGGGAVAVMMNSRYGWGTPPSMGPSEKLSFKFYDFFFRFDSIEIGIAHARAKDFYTYSAMSQPVWRWCYFALNLFGEPNMPMWKGPPGTLTADNPDTLETGAQNLDIHVESEGSGLQNALVCAWKGDEVYESGFTDWNGDVTLTIFPITEGMMYFTVTGKQTYALQDTIVIIPGTPAPYLTYQHFVVDESGNGQLDPSETAEMLVTVKNIGNATANGVTGLLRTGSQYITMPDSIADYGNLAQGDTSRGDGFTVTASSGTPPGTTVEFTIALTSSEGSWEQSFDLVVGNAPTPGYVVMDHDTGYCKLTVTALGSIGFTEPPGFDMGAGFSYPQASASQLYFSSFMLGTGPGYVADRFYSNPPTGGPNTDFEIIDSLREVVPPGSGDEHFRCAYSDDGHSSPKDISVVQHSHMVGAAGYDDFVVLAYDITNNGGSSVDAVYAGIITDFDIGSDPTTNTAGSDEARRTAFMRQQSNANPTVGLKILDPPSFANLTAVDHDRYVYPDSCMTDGQKWRILDGTISQRSSNRAYDWSVCTSVGPFDLPAGATQRVALAMLGGSSETVFAEHADSAQSWYDNNSAVFEGPGRTPVAERLACVPNPFSRSVRISYLLPVPGRTRLEVFDITGRHVTTLVDDELPAGRLDAVWNPGALANGVYLVKLETAGNTATEKLLLAR